MTPRSAKNPRMRLSKFARARSTAGPALGRQESSPHISPEIAVPVEPERELLVSASEFESTPIGRKKSHDFFCPQIPQIFTDYFVLNLWVVLNM